MCVYVLYNSVLFIPKKERYIDSTYVVLSNYLRKDYTHFGATSAKCYTTLKWSRLIRRHTHINVNFMFLISLYAIQIAYLPEHFEVESDCSRRRVNPRDIVYIYEAYLFRSTETKKKFTSFNVYYRWKAFPLEALDWYWLQLWQWGVIFFCFNKGTAYCRDCFLSNIYHKCAIKFKIYRTVVLFNALILKVVLWRLHLRGEFYILLTLLNA